MAEVPSGGVIWHPLAGIWHIGPHPQKANGPWNYSKGHLRLIAPEHYSSKINLRVRRPPFEAEDALKVRRVLRKGGIRSVD